jgi:hypothetical protein
MESTSGFVAGSVLTATAGSGTLHGGSPTSVVVQEILTTTSMKYTSTGGTTPTAGTVTNVTGVYYPTPFTNGIEPENDFTYLSRVRTQMASLSDVLVTASQLQAYVATAYTNVTRCRIYDRTQSTDTASLEIGAANSTGYVTAFVYGIGQDLGVGDKNTIGADLMSKSISGLTIGVKDFFRADVEISISIVYNEALQDYDIESLMKSIIYNSISPDNFPTNEEHLRLSYISSFLIGVDGIVSVGNITITGTDSNSDGNETNGDLKFKYKGTLPRILDIDTDITVVLIPRAV